MLIDAHDEQSRFTKREYIDELMERRKAIMLVMAAESILENKSFDGFYIDVMKDYKQYTIDEIEDRQSAIWRSLSENDCADDYENPYGLIF